MDTPLDPAEIRLGALTRRVILVCLACEVLLVALDLLFNVLDLAGDRSVRRIFNIAREQSLPTWFASTQAVLVGAVALSAAWLAEGRRRRWGWTAVGLFFIYVGADDAAEIHERVGSALGRATAEGGSTWRDSFPSFAWQLFIAPLLAVGLLFSVLFSWLQSRAGSSRVWIVVAVACFGLSQGLDFLEGIDSLESTYESLAEEFDVRVYVVTHTLKLIEEYLEMVGTTGFLAAFLAIVTELAEGRTLLLVR